MLRSITAKHLRSGFRSAAIALAGLFVGVAALPGQDLRSNMPKEGIVRVCADPDNLPLSNTKGEGFENKIAELIAKKWSSKLEYAWWPVRRGFFSRALNGRYCDIAITAPDKLDFAATTKPYYRSGYVMLYRKDSGLDIQSLADPRLKKLKIGVNLLNSDAENTPPAMALSRYGVVGNLIGFTTFYTTRADERPESIVQAVIDKTIDVAIAWGPLAGYFAKRSPDPLVMQMLEPVDSATGLPFAFNMSMATRRKDPELRDSLDRFISQNKGEILAILKDYNAPLLTLTDDSTVVGGDKKERSAKRSDPPALASGVSR